MPTRLSELLDRIRPAGAPGPPVGAGQPQPLGRDELAPVTEALRAIEAEASAVLEAAGIEAQRIESDADRRIEQLRDRLPDRLAAVRAEAERAGDRRLDADVALVRSDAERRADELDLRATETLPGLVDAAVGTIWTLIAEAEVDAS